MPESLFDVLGGFQIESAEEELVRAASREDRLRFVGAVDGPQLGELLENDADGASPLAERRKGGGDVVNVAAVAELIHEEVDGQFLVAPPGLEAVGEAGGEDEADERAEVADTVLGDDEVDGGRTASESSDLEGVACGHPTDVLIGPEFKRGSSAGENGGGDLRVLRLEGTVLGEDELVVEVTTHEGVELVPVVAEMIQEPPEVGEIAVLLSGDADDRRECYPQEVDRARRPERICVSSLGASAEHGREFSHLLPSAPVRERVEQLAGRQLRGVEDLDIESPVLEMARRELVYLSRGVGDHD